MAESKKHHSGSHSADQCGCSGDSVRPSRARGRGESLVAQDNPDDSQLGADRVSDE